MITGAIATVITPSVHISIDILMLVFFNLSLLVQVLLLEEEQEEDKEQEEGKEKERSDKDSNLINGSKTRGNRNDNSKASTPIMMAAIEMTGMVASVRNW